jgi:hypothetical protein
MRKSIIFALILSLFFVMSASAVEITFQNCVPETWVGGVKWEWKDGIKGNYEGSTYVDVPELELKGAGTLVVDLEPGDYAITYYQPRRIVQANGQIVVLPSKILDFIEISVEDKPFGLEFGCE